MSNQGYFKLLGNSPETATCELHSLTQEPTSHCVILSFKEIITYLLSDNINLGIFFPPRENKINKIKT